MAPAPDGEESVMRMEAGRGDARTSYRAVGGVDAPLVPRGLAAKVLPGCAGGEGPVCRPHLLAGVAIMPARRELAGEPDRLSRRLYLLVKSMGWQGSPTTPEVEAAWIEALGWFAGWEFPVRLSVQLGIGGNRP